MELTKDEVVLWKSASIKVDADSFILILYYYQTDKTNRANSFYKCVVRKDSLKFWEGLKNYLAVNNPAENVSTKMLGIDDNYRIIYDKRHYSNIMFSNWLGYKFSEKSYTDLETFLNKNKLPGIEHFPIKDDLNTIESGRWYVYFKEKSLIRKKKTIIF